MDLELTLVNQGVGYSFGPKGYRITKKAKGGIRHTASIPGTGISYTHETSSVFGKSKKKPTNTHNVNPSAEPIDNNNYDTTEITNGSVSDIHSEGLEEMIASANKSLKLNRYSTIGLIAGLVLGCAYPLFILLAVGCFILKIYIKKKCIIDLDYTIDEEQRLEINERMSPLKKIANSNKVWRITQSSGVIDRKYSSGASNTIKRIPCKSSTVLPFPFASNEEAVCFKSGNETLIFLPDKFFIIQKGTVGALNYSDLSSTVSGTRFVESETVPTDAKIIDKTWKYVNKNGGPDKRFSDNRQLPVCLYGELTLRSSNSSVNTVLMFSNSNIQ